MFTELFIAWLWKGRIPVAIAFSFRQKLIVGDRAQVVVSTWKDWRSIAACCLKNLVNSQIQVWE
ncbi:hypothetical protein F7734_59765 [Scytonema sp. UIC 10036]|uniref:hypothetical protein n=1 Tax=Scytonema sp. UIC 10036 TaxID=2304196 RepID=UPI0012DA3FCB|nr:hypothetical protein [Scytonema sp. UIC 10036]MUH01772.1 hypothetical protein [Scytonema sp. UIC 10036]